MYLDPAIGMFAQMDCVVFFLELEFNPWSRTKMEFPKKELLGLYTVPVLISCPLSKHMPLSPLCAARGSGCGPFPGE